MSDTGAQSWVETADGLRLSVREWGRPEGAALLLVHGQAQCHLCFAAQIASPLLQQFRIVAFDQRGHGESDRPVGAAAYRDGARFGDDIARVIAAKRLDRPVVLGWSMGGRVLREYLILHGDHLLGGLCFVGSRVLERPEYVAGRAGFWRSGEPPPLADQIEASAAFLRTCYHRQPAPEAFSKILAYNMLLSYEARAAIGGWVPDVAAAAGALVAVTVPTLVIQGRADQLVPDAAAQEVADTIAGSRLSWFEDCGHSPFQEFSLRFNTELAAFAAQCRPSLKS